MTTTSSSTRIWRTACIVLCVPLLLETIVILSQRRRHPAEEAVLVRTDTTYVRDTVLIERPAAVRTVKTVDSIRIAVTDTVRLRDTVFVRVPIEQKHYRDTSFEAWVSGYRPALDSIRIFSSTAVVTNLYERPATKSPHWAFGLQAGYGLVYTGGKFGPGPYVGVGVSYNFGRRRAAGSRTGGSGSK